MTREQTMAVMDARERGLAADEARRATNAQIVAALGRYLRLTAQLAVPLVVVIGGLVMIYGLLVLGLLFQ